MTKDLRSWMFPVTFEPICPPKCDRSQSAMIGTLLNPRGPFVHFTVVTDHVDNEKLTLFTSCSSAISRGPRLFLLV